MNRLSLRVVLVAVLVPFALVVIGVALQLAWLPDLPGTVITHWSFDGTADGFGPAWSMPLLLGLVGIVAIGVFGSLLAASARAIGPTVVQKLLAASSVFAITVVSIATTGSLAIQRGVDGPDRPDVIPLLVGGFAVAFVLSAVGWFVMPRSVSGQSQPSSAVPTVAVRDGERVVWVGHARFRTGILVAVIATIVLVTGLTVFAMTATGAWWLTVVPVIVGLSVLGTASWQVRVDRGGLTVRAALGWPRYRVTLDEIESAHVTDVVALGEFGGYGIRFGLGKRLGIITRGGEALEVKRRDGRAVVVTVDDAGTAAGLLTALAARSLQS